MPNRVTFTQLAIDRLGPPGAGRVVDWDKMLPGFGLRVAPPRPGSREGRKTWIVLGRVDGKPVMETLGTLAQIPKVDKARDLARASMAKMQGGTKPLDERRAERERKKATGEAAEAAAQEAIEGRFAVVAERFLAEHIERKCQPKYAAEVRRILEHDVLPRWADRQARGITKHDVNELLDAKASRRERARKGTTGGSAIQANRTLTRLRTLFAWAAAHDLIDGDPTAGVLLRGKERTRDRTLGDDEILWFWRGAERAGWPYGAILRLLLLTAQREGEVAGMRWSELDLEKRLWTIPRERTKSRPRRTPCTCRISRRRSSGRCRGCGDLVFPSRVGTPIASFAKPKQRLDDAMTAQLREARGDPEAELDAWIIHDLRRTATTIMARLNVAPHVADKILNHSAGTIRGVAAIVQPLRLPRRAQGGAGGAGAVRRGPGAAGWRQRR